MWFKPWEKYIQNTEHKTEYRREGLILSRRGRKGFAGRVTAGQGFEGYLGVFQVIRRVWYFSCSMKRDLSQDSLTMFRGHEVFQRSIWGWGSSSFSLSGRRAKGWELTFMQRESTVPLFSPAASYMKPRLCRAAKIGLELVRLILSYIPLEVQKAEL